MSGSVIVDVSVNGVDITGTGVVLEYVDFPLINSIYPSYGPITGGTVLHLHGNRMSNISTLSCRIGNGVSFPATYHTTSHISCVTPSGIIGKGVVQVSVNGIHFTSTRLLYEYVNEITIVSVMPSIGPESGNSIVRIKVDNLGPRNQLMCEFGSSKYRTSAEWDSTLMSVLCTAPSQAPGAVKLRISTNGQQYSKSYINYEYTYEESVYKIFPSAGMRNVGTVVSVLGTNFLNSSSLSCKFGHLVVSAAYINSTSLRCQSPVYAKLVTKESKVVVDVSNNGVDFSSNQVEFTYYEDIEVTNVYPLSGPSSGGTNVFFAGSGYSNYLDISCSFGDDIVEAIIVSDSSLFCVSPIFLGSLNSQVQLKIYVNDHELSPKSYAFTYFSFPVISGVDPLSGPETGGWTLSILFDRNTTFSTRFMCKFSGSSSLSVATNHFGYSVCEVPALEVGSSSIEVTFDGALYFPIGYEVLIHPRISMTALSPNFGYVNNNQSITILGTGMSNFDLCCEFDGSIYNGNRINDTAIECIPPIVLSARRSLVRVVDCNSFSPFIFDEKDEFLVYEYIKGEIVKSINPSLGFVSGGTEVEITGSGFLAPTKYLCTFNLANVSSSVSIVISAVRMNDRLLRCESPQYLTLVIIFLEFTQISLNPRHYWAPVFFSMKICLYFIRFIQILALSWVAPL